MGVDVVQRSEVVRMGGVAHFRGITRVRMVDCECGLKTATQDIEAVSGGP